MFSKVFDFFASSRAQSVVGILGLVAGLYFGLFFERQGNCIK